MHCLRENEKIEVDVVQVVSPDEIWVQPCSSTASTAATITVASRSATPTAVNMAAFNRSAESEFPVGGMVLSRRGRSCTRNTDDTNYYRAKICSEPKQNKQGTMYVRVLFVDLGVAAWVPAFQLRSLPPDLIDISWQVIPCCLAQVQSADNEVWSSAVCRQLQRIVANGQRMAREHGAKCRMKVLECDRQTGWHRVNLSFELLPATASSGMAVPSKLVYQVNEALREACASSKLVTAADAPLCSEQPTRRQLLQQRTQRLDCTLPPHDHHQPLAGCFAARPLTTASASVSPVIDTPQTSTSTSTPIQEHGEGTTRNRHPSGSGRRRTPLPVAAKTPEDTRERGLRKLASIRDQCGRLEYQDEAGVVHGKLNVFVLSLCGANAESFTFRYCKQQPCLDPVDPTPSSFFVRPMRHGAGLAGWQKELDEFYAAPGPHRQGLNIDHVRYMLSSRQPIYAIHHVDVNALFSRVRGDTTSASFPHYCRVQLYYVYVAEQMGSLVKRNEKVYLYDGMPITDSQLNQHWTKYEVLLRYLDHGGFARVKLTELAVVNKLHLRRAPYVLHTMFASVLSPNVGDPHWYAPISHKFDRVMGSRDQALTASGIIFADKARITQRHYRFEQDAIEPLPIADFALFDVTDKAGASLKEELHRKGVLDVNRFSNDHSIFP